MPRAGPQFDAEERLQVLSRYQLFPQESRMLKFSPGRRRFTFGAAAAATTALILPADAVGQAVSKKQPPVQSSPALAALQRQAKEAMAKLPVHAQAEVEMKVSEIFRKYGDQLTVEQKIDIRRVMAETQDGLEKMRAFALENGDQPATVFRAYRGEGEK